MTLSRGSLELTRILGNSPVMVQSLPQESDPPKENKVYFVPWTYGIPRWRAAPVFVFASMNVELYLFARVQFAKAQNPVLVLRGSALRSRRSLQAFRNNPKPLRVNVPWGSKSKPLTNPLRQRESR